MRSVTASTGGRPAPSGRRATRGGTTGTQVVVPSNGRAPDLGPGATIRPRPFRFSTGAARSSRAGRGGTRGTRVVAPSVRADCGGRARASGSRVVGAAGGGAASPPAPRGRATGAFDDPTPGTGRCRCSGTTGTYVVSGTPVTGSGMTATRRVNASVAGSAGVRTWRERPFVFAAAPAVRASFPMRSPSLVHVFRFRAIRTPVRPDIASTPIYVCLRDVRSCFANRPQSLGRTIATAISCVNNGCAL
jgi:hypothetical protein